jgi:hypothetical protein
MFIASYALVTRAPEERNVLDVALPELKDNRLIYEFLTTSDSVVFG